MLYITYSPAKGYSIGNIPAPTSAMRYLPFYMEKNHRFYFSSNDEKNELYVALPCGVYPDRNIEAIEVLPGDLLFYVYKEDNGTRYLYYYDMKNDRAYCNCYHPSSKIDAEGFRSAIEDEAIYRFKDWYTNKWFEITKDGIAAAPARESGKSSSKPSLDKPAEKPTVKVSRVTPPPAKATVTVKPAPAADDSLSSLDLSALVDAIKTIAEEVIEEWGL